MPHISDPLLQAYIDGCCDDARRTQIEAHFDTCEQCRSRFERARNAATRASQLLRTLDPGPVHAPSFEELQARATARAAGGEAEAAAGNEAPSAASDKASSAAGDAVDGAPWVMPVPPKVPLWRRPALAWVATIVMAFGLGWLSRSELGLPADLAAPATPALDEIAPQATVAGRRSEGAEGALERFALGADLDDAQAAAKRTAVAESEAQPASPVPAVVPEESVLREQVARNRAAPGTSNEPRAAAESRAAGGPPAEEVAPPVAADKIAAAAVEADEETGGRAGGFADAEPTTGFVAVAREDAELWLGAAPRELPDLALVRVEVGPGVLVENGLPGRPAVRLVYVARSGQEISLLQQYTGPLTDARQEQVGARVADRPDAAAAPARAERARDAEFRATRKLSADRDALVAVGTLDLPVTERLPDGTNVYRWVDDAGYLLSISGAVEPDLLRALADVIR